MIAVVTMIFGMGLVTGFAIGEAVGARQRAVAGEREQERVARLRKRASGA